MIYLSSRVSQDRATCIPFRELLVIAMFALTGCVSIPDTNKQAAELARQQFGPRYHMAITSYYRDTRVQTNMTNQVIESFTSTSSTALHEIQFSSVARRDSLSGRLSSMADFYNSQNYVSEIEEKFGEKLEKALRVTPEFLSRAEIQETLDDEMLETSAMMHAKKIATRKGYDAVLVVYFEPVLSEVATFPDRFDLSYNALVAVRSIPDDKLLYLKNGSYRCSQDLLWSYAARAETQDSMKRCEEQIHTRIIDDFLKFTKAAGVKLKI